jgi:hypothetical protein
MLTIHEIAVNFHANTLCTICGVLKWKKEQNCGTIQSVKEIRSLTFLTIGSLQFQKRYKQTAQNLHTFHHSLIDQYR